jgi:uncharacterized protein involved in oxidation of intracellular sulfur
MITILVIVNDQPYGSERPYNALRLAGALAKRDGVDLRVFLLGDAVACAVGGQRLPDGHYHLDRMLKPLVRRGEVGCCGTCLDARGLSEEQLVEGARRSTLEELTDWTLWADKTLVSDRDAGGVRARRRLPKGADFLAFSGHKKYAPYGAARAHRPALRIRRR